jgi:parallel beta-helix repeat protein
MTLPAALRRVFARQLGAAIIAALYFSLNSSHAIAKTIMLSPGENIQSKVEANPPYTTFILRTGIYRVASVTPKNGDTFIGQQGAVMDGAIRLRNWKSVSIGGATYWTTFGGVPLVSRRCGARAPCCVSDHPGCVYVQNLYIDGVDYRHVLSLADVVRGSWYYDFDGRDGGIQNNVYLAATENPNSRNVELGRAVYAFTGTASNVTIQNLIIEKYSAPIQSAAVEPKGPGWLIQGNEIRLNHGFGVKAKEGGDDVRVIDNIIHHNGEMGIGSGKVHGGLWDSNRVEYNNVDGVNPGFEAGGSKFVGDHIMISHNIVHDNFGTGLWSDEGATYNTYDHNTCFHNFGGGIRYEISRYGVIKNNVVYDNMKDAQIVYTGSDHGRIVGNTTTNDAAGGIFVQNIVGTRRGTIIYKVTDTRVTGNTIIITNRSKIVTGLLDFARPPQPEIFHDPTNFFAHNIYKMPSDVFVTRNSSAGLFWSWGENPHGGPNRIRWQEWRANGQDTDGKLETLAPPKGSSVHRAFPAQ